MTIFKDDIKNNRKNSKGLIFIIAFRISAMFTRSLILKIIGFPIRVLYKITFQWIAGIDISDTTKIGSGFMVYHGQGLVINANTKIGRNVKVRQSTTIGNSASRGGCPEIGDNVQIGSNSVIIGKISIGPNVIIGAGSVVVKSIPPNSTVVGNPARIIK